MKNSIRLTAFFIIVFGFCGNAQVRSLKNIFQKKLSKRLSPSATSDLDHPMCGELAN